MTTMTRPGTVGTVQLYAGALPRAEIDGESFRLVRPWGGITEDAQTRANKYAHILQQGVGKLVAIGHGQYAYLYCGRLTVATRSY